MEFGRFGWTFDLDPTLQHSCLNITCLNLILVNLLPALRHMHLYGVCAQEQRMKTKQTQSTTHQKHQRDFWETPPRWVMYWSVQLNMEVVIVYINTTRDSINKLIFEINTALRVFYTWTSLWRSSGTLKETADYSATRKQLRYFTR